VTKAYPGPEGATLRELRDFIKNLAIGRKTLIQMPSFFFVLRPSATFRDLPRLFATLIRDLGRDCAKVGSRI
jgi:hypothetical protein